MALAILATMRGIPQVFYGTEILLANPDSESHGVIRADYPGGWPDDPTSAFTGNGLDAAARDLQAELRHLLRWRRTATAVHTGKLQHYTPDTITVRSDHPDFLVTGGTLWDGRQLADLRNSALFVLVGGGLDEWIVSLSGEDASLLRLSDGITLIHGDDPGEEEAEGHGHSHAEGNPHIWLDPTLMASHAAILSEWYEKSRGEFNG